MPLSNRGDGIDECKVKDHPVTQQAQTLAGTWHWNERLRQRPMPTLMLKHCSKRWDQCAPARRQSGRRTFDHLPPPPTCLCDSKHLPRGAAPAVVRRQCWPRAGHAVQDYQRCTARLGASSGKTHSGTDLLWQGHARPRRGTLLHPAVGKGNT